MSGLIIAFLRGLCEGAVARDMRPYIGKRGRVEHIFVRGNQLGVEWSEAL